MEFLTLEQRPRAVTSARHWVLDACRRRGLTPDARDAVELVTAEMVGNAVKHGEGRIVLTLDATPPFVAWLTGDPEALPPSVVVVAVTDGGSARPLPRSAADDATTGRGLFLVEALALRWGVTAVVSRGEGLSHNASGKTTWALLTTVGD